MRRPHAPQLLAVSLIGLACASSSKPSAEAPAKAPSDAPGATTTDPAAVDEPAPALLSPSPATPAAAETPPAEGKDARGKEAIQRVIADNRPKVRACYEAALKENPGIQGDLMLSFVIDPEGNVKDAEVNWAESELHIPELDSCAIEAVKSLKFPASSRGLESKVNYPFNFNPAPPDPRPKDGTATPPSGAR